MCGDLGIPESTFSGYFNGKTVPGMRHRQILHRITGIQAFAEGGRGKAPPLERGERQEPAPLSTQLRDPKMLLSHKLREWFKSIGKYNTIAEMARATGFRESTLRDYFLGRAFPRGEKLVRLANATGIDIPSIARGGKPALREEKTETPRVAALRVRSLLKNLVEALLPFKVGPPEARRVFAKTIAGRDIGYITTLLRALYDEDRFEEWVYFADYKTLTDEDDKE
jgi:transcriptional regulator with XRE-family HTH domain